MLDTMNDAMGCSMADVDGIVHGRNHGVVFGCSMDTRHGRHHGPTTDTRHSVARAMGAHGIFHGRVPWEQTMTSSTVSPW